MNPWVLICSITAPITLLLVWAIACEVMGKPMFREGASASGNVDGLGRLIVGVIYVVIIVGSLFIGGFKIVVLVLTAIGGLAAGGALIWTIAQNIRHAWAAHRGVLEASPVQELSPFNHRLTANLVALAISIPVNLVAFV